MSSNPDTIRRDIEVTRERLAEDVDVLGESVRPSNVAHRAAHRATGRLSTVKDRIMGTAGDLGSTSTGVAHQAADATTAAPRLARRQTQGSPLAAGAIALGLGWIVGSLIPSSERERRLASAAQEQAQPLVEEAKSVAQEAANDLRQPAADAASAVKERAAEGAQQVKDEGRAAAHDVKESAKEKTASSDPTASGQSTGGGMGTTP